MLCLKKLEKEEKTESKFVRRKEVIKIRARKNKIENMKRI